MHGTWARRAVRLAGAGVVALGGCLGRDVPAGYLPPPSAALDARSAEYLTPGPRMTPPAPPEVGKGPRVLDLPTGLPGADAPRVRPPRFAKDTPPAERLRMVREAYPELVPAGAAETPPGDPLSLADLQQLARVNSPVLRRAEADAGVAYGQMVQAGLHPNPTVGWEADQVVPGGTPRINNAGQQGAFVNQLVKTPGKLNLAQSVARFDYINAYVAVRRAEVDVATAVRTNYFQVLLAQKGLEVSGALAALADEVYRLQLRQLAAGEAAGYEPLQLYAQAVQARNALALARANYHANWRQLAAAVGRPDLPAAPLAGSVEQPAPLVDPAAARERVVEAHTDVLTARNRILQAQTNLRLQKFNRVPDMTVNYVNQHDNALSLHQYNLQLGFPLPVWDRNQGNIRAAESQITSNIAALAAAQNDLTGRLADALGRFEANRVAVENFRERVLPALTQAYQGIIRRYQQEPADVPGGKVAFNDIVVAQQNLAMALQGYLTALTAQWQAVVDLAGLLQVDELYPTPPAAPPGPDDKK
jgi:cobalt-zinc-cadmium efflux system outer membrane protein